MPCGHAYAKAVRTVKTCVGTDFCRFGARRLDRRSASSSSSALERLYTPHKVKIGVTRLPAQLRRGHDQGHRRDGDRGRLGGLRRRRRRACACARATCSRRVEHAAEALEASHLFLQHYRENAEYLERTYDFVERARHHADQGRDGRRARRDRAPALLERFAALARDRERAVVDAKESSPPRRTSSARCPRWRPGAALASCASACSPTCRSAKAAPCTSGAREIALFRTGEREVHAIHARCPHANGPLADGILAGGKVTCPLHAWKVDVATGAAVSPAGNCDAVPTYPLELRGDEIWIDVPARGRPDAMDPNRTSRPRIRARATSPSPPMRAFHMTGSRSSSRSSPGSASRR